MRTAHHVGARPSSRNVWLLLLGTLHSLLSLHLLNTMKTNSIEVFEVLGLLDIRDGFGIEVFATSRETFRIAYSDSFSAYGLYLDVYQLAEDAALWNSLGFNIFLRETSWTVAPEHGFDRLAPLSIFQIPEAHPTNRHLWVLRFEPSDMSDLPDENLRRLIHIKALEVAYDIGNLGLGEPIISDSGMGTDLIYRVNTTDEYVNSDLLDLAEVSLAHVYNDDNVVLAYWDTILGFFRFYGTTDWRPKSSVQVDRYFRKCRLRSVPAQTSYIGNRELELLISVLDAPCSL